LATAVLTAALFVSSIGLAAEPPQAQAPESPESSAQQAEPEWVGSFGLAGTNSRFAIGGFAQLDVIYDTDAIGTRCEFVTSAIPTVGGTPSLHPVAPMDRPAFVLMRHV